MYTTGRLVCLWETACNATKLAHHACMHARMREGGGGAGGEGGREGEGMHATYVGFVKTPADHKRKRLCACGLSEEERCPSPERVGSATGAPLSSIARLGGRTAKRAAEGPSKARGGHIDVADGFGRTSRKWCGRLAASRVGAGVDLSDDQASKPKATNTT